MKVITALAFASFICAASAQRLAWKVEIPDAESVEVVAPDGVGGCVVVVRSPWPDSDYRAVWLSNKGAKKGEIELPGWGNWGSGPFMVTPTRFYVSLSEDEGATMLLRRVDLKKGVVALKDTPLEAGEFLRNVPDASDKTGFFIAPADPGQGTTTVHITRYSH